MSYTPAYCPCGKVLHTKHCLAKLFNCSPRAVVRMAAQGRWRSTRVSVGAVGVGEYRFTNEMIAEIVQDGESALNKPSANEPAPREQKAPKLEAARRTRQPPPPPNPVSNVRPLVAKRRRSA
jgi:hypothetical protein